MLSACHVAVEGSNTEEIIQVRPTRFFSKSNCFAVCFELFLILGIWCFNYVWFYNDTHNFTDCTVYIIRPPNITMTLFCRKSHFMRTHFKTSLKTKHKSKKCKNMSIYFCASLREAGDLSCVCPASRPSIRVHPRRWTKPHLATEDTSTQHLTKIYLWRSESILLV